ncbi:MAG: DUF1461 domain-containing protein [Pseudomonadota bacterium]
MSPIGIRQLADGLHWVLLFVSLSIAILYLSWKVLAPVDYGYSIWYELLNIDKTIEEEGPRNRFRPMFHITDRAERERLFGAIVEAINNNGEGLAELVYHDPDGKALGPLLTNDEVIHLKDVANLVGFFRGIAWGSAGVFVVLAIAAWARRMSPPSPGRIAMGCGVFIGGGALSIVAIGPVRVFYALHEVVFPSEHKWFFYYDESLMSMMMQAPNLFGPIALLWLALALLLFVVVWLTVAKGLRKRANYVGETTRNS